MLKICFLDFDDDNDITKYDLIDILDKLTTGSELEMDEKSQICDIVSIPLPIRNNRK